MMLGFVGLALLAWWLASWFCAVFFMRWWTVIPVGLVLFALMAAPVVAFGRDLDGKYANSPNHEWISHLTNKLGGLCCDEADGQRIEDPDWRQNEDGTYSVKLNGEWTVLSEYQIVTEPNRLGFAMVWIWRGQITCFLPGPRS